MYEAIRLEESYPALMYCCVYGSVQQTSTKCKFIQSILLSATYKMTNGPLHVSLGILVTCETQ